MPIRARLTAGLICRPGNSAARRAPDGPSTAEPGADAGPGAAQRRRLLLETLGVSATDPARYTWEPVAPGDPDYLDHNRRMLHAVADRARWQATINEARRRALNQAVPDLSATGTAA